MKRKNEMLKNISPLLSPELLKVLCEMGHGDELVIGDGNFPAASMNNRVIRMDGHDVPEILKAVLSVFPLDYAQSNMVFMAVSPGDKVETPIWKEYDRIAKEGDSNYKGYGTIERFAFYERTRKAYAVITTSEKALYANVLLKKGVIK